MAKTERFEMLLEPHQKKRAVLAAELLQISVAELARLGLLAVSNAVIAARALPVKNDE